MELSINENIVNKGDPRTQGWKNAEFTIEQLISHIIKDGLAWGPGILKESAGGKKPAISDIQGAVLLGIDIDNSVKEKNKETGKYAERSKTLSEGYFPYQSAQSDSWLKANAAFMYRTPSYTDEWNRFRIVFLLPNQISSPEEYSLTADSFIKKFGGDPACKDISRFFYGCKDADYVHFSSEPLNQTILDSIINSGKEESDVIKEYNTENTNFSISADQVSEILGYIPGDSLSYSDWFKCMSAVGNTFYEETAIRLIENWSPDKDNGTAYKIKHRALKPQIATLIYYAKQYGFNAKKFYKKNYKQARAIKSKKNLLLNNAFSNFPEDCIFWEEFIVNQKTGATTLKIIKSKFINYINYHGFYKFWLDNNSSTFVYSKNNIVEEVVPDKIWEYLQKSFDNLPEDISDNYTNKDLWETIFQKIYIYSSKDFFSKLKVLENKFLKDSVDHGYFFFKNGYVETSADGPQFHNYGNIDMCIWKEQMIDHDFVLLSKKEGSDTNSSHFGQFLEKLCSSADPEYPHDRSKRNLDVNRFKSLITGIGYLLHSYKDPTVPKAIIFCEEKIAYDDEANGRSGKGLTSEAISYLRRRAILDGKRVDLHDRFYFQTISIDTQFIFWDDTRKGFDFEGLFSIMTEGLTIERKGQKAFRLPFSDSPKILIATNSVLTNDSDSHRARKHEIEFSDYFTADYTPFDEFETKFFNQGWKLGDDNWNKFYNLMIYFNCYYLKNGLLNYEQKNLSERKLLAKLPEDFLDFIEKYKDIFTNGGMIYHDQLHTEFTTMHKIYGPNGKLAKSIKTTTKWFNEYIKFKKLVFIDEQTGANNERRRRWVFADNRPVSIF
jgi:hypothetical protein